MTFYDPLTGEAAEAGPLTGGTAGAGPSSGESAWLIANGIVLAVEQASIPV